MRTTVLDPHRSLCIALITKLDNVVSAKATVWDILTLLLLLLLLARAVTEKTREGERMGEVGPENGVTLIEDSAGPFTKSVDCEEAADEERERELFVCAHFAWLAAAPSATSANKQALM